MAALFCPMEVQLIAAKGKIKFGDILVVTVDNSRQRVVFIRVKAVGPGLVVGLMFEKSDNSAW